MILTETSFRKKRSGSNSKHLPSKIIYLDHHATTPLDPRVLKAMLPYFQEKFGNPASRTHVLGAEAGNAVDRARQQIARLIHAEPREIIFTSGATESNNLALKGAAQAYREKGNHIITVMTEHKSVLDPCRRLETQGFQITCLRVGKDGLLDLRDLESAITSATILISVMFANNEIGVIQPVAQIAKLARDKNILFHCDAAQAVGKIPVDVKAVGADLLSFSAHKLNGPKGVGALYIRKDSRQVRLVPWMDGGGHEVGMRSGTLNVPGIAGLGQACEISLREMKKESKRTEGLRNRLREGILKKTGGSFVNGNQEHRLPNNLNISFEGVSADKLIGAMKGIAVSSGSACLSTSPEPSYVLKAIGLTPEQANSSVRFGLGRFTTQNEIDRTIEIVTRSVRNLRSAKLS